ncbi:polysaccharide deacetylase family protein [Paenibacillus puldeungensis]|uniref:Polysaccharide deacetylase family protein n=1 Tax=Paenibacillus puldeungensis TaxID=696536 RepID=A0ABW3RTS9_9BACL
MLDIFTKKRYIIINADDLGITRTTNQAIFALLQKNVVTSASLMVPCAHAHAAVRLCKRINKPNIGIHLTLTSVESQYLKPVFRSKHLRTLTTEEGFFPHDISEVEKKADPEEARMELEAQIASAISFGLDPTHLDSHAGSIMGLNFDRDFLEIAFDLCEKFRLPFNLPQRIIEQPFYTESQKQRFAQRIESAKRRGILLIHDLYSLPYQLQEGEDYDDIKREFIERLQHLGPGITQIVAHPSLTTPEIQALTPHYKKREIEFRLFSDPEIVKLMNKEGLELISWRVVRDFQRAMCNN